MIKKIKKFLLIIFLLFELISFNFYFVQSDDLENDTTNINSNIVNSLETSSTEISEKIPTTNSRSCVVIDRLTKQILYGKNENNQVKMASTTKIMTAIIVIENGNLDKTTEISKKAAMTGGSRLGLKTNDKITIYDLLYGLLLCSGNDAAVALAEYVAGGVPEFADLMNQKAIALGLGNTKFESPHGLDSDNHYTTAYELALLTDYALNNSTFAKIVKTKKYTVTINGFPKSLNNTNELLGNLDGVYGVKTGFTNGANRCLVSSCKRNDMDIICVVLGADTKKFRTQDSIKLIEYTFKNFEHMDIKPLIEQELLNCKQKYNNIYIYKGNPEYITFNILNLENTIITINKTEKNNIKTISYINDKISVPIYKNSTPIGYIKVICGNETIENIDIISDVSVFKKTWIDYFAYFLKNSLNSYSNCLKF